MNNNYVIALLSNHSYQVESVIFRDYMIYNVNYTCHVIL
jgi:hypothetical protein